MSAAAFAAECASCSRRWTAIVENPRMRFGLQCPGCRQAHGFFAGTTVAHFDSVKEAEAFFGEQENDDAAART